MSLWQVNKTKNPSVTVLNAAGGMKIFKAPTIAAALAQVKRQFGPDAVVVQTRTVRQGGLMGLGAKTVYEVTARSASKQKPTPRPNRIKQYYQNSAPSASPALSSVSSSAAAAAVQMLAAKDRTAPATLSTSRWPVAQAKSSKSVPVAPVIPEFSDSAQAVKDEVAGLKQLVENLVKEQRKFHEPQMPEQLYDVYLDLIQREVADEVARELVGAVQSDITGNQMQNADIVRRKLAGMMENMINAAGPVCRNVDGSARVVALIGPTGVGKTTTVAKLAADFKLRQQKRVSLITIDTYRIGAIDQLKMYAQILDVPLKVVLNPNELRDTIAEMKTKYDIILIDTAGRSQKDQLKLKELQTFIDAAQPDETHLVLSTTAHHAHMLSAAQEFQKIGVDRLILTKLDEAISFGVVLSVMKKVNASLSYVTTGQAVPDDIEIGTGRKMARMLLGLEAIKSQEQPELTTA